MKLKFYCICNGSPLKVVAPLVKEVDAKDAAYGARPYCPECGRSMLPEVEYENLIRELRTIYGDEARARRTVDRYLQMD